MENAQSIVRAAIYPPIGVARVGNSQHEYFLGPEVPEPLPAPQGFYRDPAGALKRQAARFRVYGLDAEGNAVAELNACNAEVNWTAYLANKKSAWYQFQLALDIPEAASAPASLLRNATVTNRASLSIDPGPRSISGKSQHGGKHHLFDTGSFVGKHVYLGEVRTDDEGRLIVLGGRGVSASSDGSKLLTFANNEAWHDDVSDGPVTATVKFDGRELEVEPAWVIVAPPDYAPMQKSVRTMWDLMRDLAISSKRLPKPSRPSFQNDIRPLFERMHNLQWVNAGFAAAFGWRGPNNLAAPEWLERLSKSNPDDKEMRLTIANQFRVFDRDSYAQQPWPWVYGDAMNIPPADTPRQNTALTNTQLGFLQQWAAGEFDEDYNPNEKPPRKVEDAPVADQPNLLTRGAMEFCLADAFHPGCEMTWPVRTPEMYMAPFRFAHAPAGWIEPSYGMEFLLDAYPTGPTIPTGPLAGQVPGGITRWMAVPWQADTASCRSGYQKSYDPYVPTFWPARVPNQVLTEEHYQVVMDKSKDLSERMAAFAKRALWWRGLGTTNYTDQINNMVSDFGNLGLVENRPGPGDPEFPAEMQVENIPAAHKPRLKSLMLEKRDVPEEQQGDVDLSDIAKVHRFPRGLRR